MSFMKKAVAPAVSALALVFAVSMAGADAGDAMSAAPKGITPQEPLAQQQVEMLCFVDDVLSNGLKDQYNMVAKETGDHPDWQLQLYANDKGAWALAGVPKDNSIVEGATPDMKVSCLLGGPTEGGYPDQVRQQKWYKDFFQPAVQPSGPSI